MAGSTFGTIFKLTTFGESHGQAIGGIIEGCPAGLTIDLDFVQAELNRRRPGQNHLVTPRNEADQVQWLSGIKNGKTLGTPIGFLVFNTDQKPADYALNRSIYRPSHSDFVYEQKYQIRDENGGGRSSARETISRVVAGAIAQLLLKEWGIQIQAYTSQIGPYGLNAAPTPEPLWYPPASIEQSLVRCPDASVSHQMEQYIQDLQSKGDTTGGIITGLIQGVPAGLGEPVFDKLHADLGKAMLSINAVKGFEYGSGFKAATMLGSEHNDPFVISNNHIITSTNHSGGIQGGISNGSAIYFNVAFKPVSTIKLAQQSIDGLTNQVVEFTNTGRHDACVIPRAVPIVQAMAALVIADHYLRNKLVRL